MDRTKIQNEKMFMLEDEIYSDSIIPFHKKELKRNVNLHGKVFLKGGIYCQHLDVEGKEIFIQKSVFAEDAISIRSSQTGLIWFNSPVSAGHSILVDEDCKCRVRFGKTIESKTVNLNNSIVYGNIISENAILRNTVVLGGVYCKQRLEVENSILGTYHCRNLVQTSNLGLLYPIALSEDKPEISDKLYIVIPTTGTIEDAINVYTITNDDFYKVAGEQGPKYLYSNTLRIFDMKQYSSRLRSNLAKLYENYAYDPSNPEETLKSFAEFDDLYFNFIESDFKSSGKAVYSDFMEIDSHLINDFSSGLGPSAKASMHPGEPVHISEEVRTAPPFYEPEARSRFKLDKAPPVSEIFSGNINEQTKSVLECPACGSAIEETDYIFCPDCGNKIQS